MPVGPPFTDALVTCFPSLVPDNPRISQTEKNGITLVAAVWTTLLPLFGQEPAPGHTFRNLVGIVAFILTAAFLLYLTRSKKK